MIGFHIGYMYLTFFLEKDYHHQCLGWTVGDNYLQPGHQGGPMGEARFTRGD
jgi:hypothetical protein